MSKGLRLVLLILLVAITRDVWAGFVTIQFDDAMPVNLVNGKFEMKKSQILAAETLKRASSDLHVINALISETVGARTSGHSSRAVRGGYADFPAEQLEQWKKNAEKYWNEQLPDLRSFYSVEIDSPANDRAIFKRYQMLKTLGSVKSVDVVEDAIPAQLETPSFVSSQGYLNNDDNGIYARQARNIAGGRGNGIKIVDFEGAWNSNHEDFPALFYDSGNHNTGLNGAWLSHGTAVMGILGAVDNDLGVVGIADQANFGVQSNVGEPYGELITRAAMQAGPGGVVVIEFQFGQFDYTPVCNCGLAQCGFVALEYQGGAYNAIKQAVGNGVIVVEAGGNGSVDFDAPSLSDKFDRDVRDSGAIVVGAGLSQKRAPQCFTNYGERVDVHGWGDSVATLGFGSAYSGDGTDNQNYTLNFSGTSSAAAIVAGAVASIQGIVKAHGLPALTPSEMRELLTNTATPQIEELERKIGGLPNIMQAIKELDLTPRVGFLPVIIDMLIMEPEASEPPEPTS